MAKYKIGRTTAGLKSINCAILDENCLSDTYTVQFESGVIKNVPKYNVYDFDKVDKALLETLNEGMLNRIGREDSDNNKWNKLGRGIRRGIHDLVASIKSAFGNNISYTVGSTEFLDSCVAVMNNAKGNDLVRAYIPSESFAESHKEVNMIVTDDGILDGKDIHDDVTTRDMTEVMAFFQEWHQKIVESEFDEDVVNEFKEEYDKRFDPSFFSNGAKSLNLSNLLGESVSVDGKRKRIDSKLLEGVQLAAQRDMRFALNEANSKIEMETVAIVEMNAESITRFIISQYEKLAFFRSMVGRPLDQVKLAEFMSGVIRGEDGTLKFDKVMKKCQDLGIVKDDVDAEIDSARTIYQMFVDADLGIEDPNCIALGEISKLREIVAYAVLMIWGAPGIGKTQIVGSCVKELKKMGYKNGRDGKGDVSLQVVSALGMEPTDITYPANKEYTVNGSVAGKGLSFKETRTVDIVKSWLPTWSSTNADSIYEQFRRKGFDVTYDEVAQELDNIANGGKMATFDDDGNLLGDRIEGHGGIVFIDELSRIAPPTMNVLMTVFQSRVIGDNYVGSKWLFVTAGNRFSDMGTYNRGGTTQWEKAWNDRLIHVCFRPTVQEWLNWAKKNMVAPWIISYITLYNEMWYNSSYALNSNDEVPYAYDRAHKGVKGWKAVEPAAMLMFPNPRQWAQVSNTYLLLKEHYSEEDARWFAMAANIGYKAADRYHRDMSTNGFNDENAYNVVHHGLSAVINDGVPLQTNSHGLGVAIQDQGKSADKKLKYTGAIGRLFKLIKKMYVDDGINMLKLEELDPKTHKMVHTYHVHVDNTGTIEMYFFNICLYLYASCRYMTKNPTLTNKKGSNNFGTNNAGNQLAKKVEDNIEAYVNDIFGWDTFNIQTATGVVKGSAWQFINDNGAVPGQPFYKALRLLREVENVTSDNSEYEPILVNYAKDHLAADSKDSE